MRDHVAPPRVRGGAFDPPRVILIEFQQSALFSGLRVKVTVNGPPIVTK